MQDLCRHPPTPKPAGNRPSRLFQATHIFDGLDSWPTHVLFLSQGQAKVFATTKNIVELKESRLMNWVVR